MKKMNYKKPLAEVIDLDATDILTATGSGEKKYDGQVEYSGVSAAGLKIENGSLVMQ